MCALSLVSWFLSCFSVNLIKKLLLLVLLLIIPLIPSIRFYFYFYQLSLLLAYIFMTTSTSTTSTSATDTTTAHYTITTTTTTTTTTVTLHHSRTDSLSKMSIFNVFLDCHKFLIIFVLFFSVSFYSYPRNLMIGYWLGLIRHLHLMTNQYSRRSWSWGSPESRPNILLRNTILYQDIQKKVK